MVGRAGHVEGSRGEGTERREKSRRNLVDTKEDVGPVPDHLGVTTVATVEGLPRLPDRDKQAGVLHLLLKEW